MKTPEGQRKDKVKLVLDKHKAYRFMPVQMGYGERALDFFVCHYGRFIAVEVKREGKGMTGLQNVCRQKIQDAGGSVFLVSNDAELALLDRALSDIERVYTSQLRPIRARAIDAIND